MLRIGHFLHHYPVPGGVTTAVEGLSRALAKLGHVVFLYGCGDGYGLLPGETRQFNVIHFENPSTSAFEVPGELTRRLSTNSDKLDLLLIHGMFNPHNMAAAKAATRGGIPFVVSPHGTYSPAMLSHGRLKKLVFGALYERPFLNSAISVQVQAEAHVCLLSAYGVNRPAFVVPNGFDASAAPRPRPAGSDSPRAGTKLLYFGRRDVHTKGLDLLLEGLALGIHRNQLPADLTLNLTGPSWGDQTKLTRLLRRRELRDRVFFSDRVNPEERWSRIAECDLLVLPSRHEGFGLSALEAMAVGRPVVVSTAAGIADWVKRAGSGFLVEPVAESICAGLVHAIQVRDAWPQMADAGKEMAYSRLTWGTIAAGASTVYEGLLQSSPESRLQVLVS